MRKTILFSSLKALLSGIVILASVQAAQAQEAAKYKPATIVWANSFYGRNNSGIGIGARYSAFGLGATVFNFAGDTSIDKTPRPGAICISGDFYLAIDFSDWIALYGNIGYAGRLMTYKEQRELLRNSSQRDFLSVGAGIQITFASHLVLGAGYNFIVDTPDEEGDETEETIQSIVAQIGYRL